MHMNQQSAEAVTIPLTICRMSYYLHPGQFFFSTEACAVTTILGSCVSVCLWDPITRIGGINHFLLPRDLTGTHAIGRFGNLAVRRLIDELIAAGVNLDDLQAKLFGGACVLEAFRDRKNHLGSHNIQIAREALAAASIPIVGADVGGCKGRKLIFYTDNGSAWVREL